MLHSFVGSLFPFGAHIFTTFYSPHTKEKGKPIRFDRSCTDRQTAHFWTRNHHLTMGTKGKGRKKEEKESRGFRSRVFLFRKDPNPTFFPLFDRDFALGHLEKGSSGRHTKSLNHVIREGSPAGWAFSVSAGLFLFQKGATSDIRSSSPEAAA